MKPELLLPAGNFEKLKTAVENGADAVYFGAKKFNARIGAGNFSSEELKQAVDFCHENGARAYITMNTLVKNQEINSFFAAVKEAYLAGADAVIIQEVSLAPLIKQNFPGMEIHASTQSMVMNLESIKKLKCIDRVILARELSKKEVEFIAKNSLIPVEIFVHGALCFCVSGRCLMSSFIHRKSGNRGMCLQPCRKKYNGSYLMSMKDLCLIDYLNEISNSGVSAFKIEGRMRSREYVETITKVYRKAIDKGSDGNDSETAKSAFNRELTKGFFGGEADKTSRHNLKFERLKSDYTYVNSKKPIVVKRNNAVFSLPEIKLKSSEQTAFYVKVYNVQGVKDACENENVSAVIYSLGSSDAIEAKKVCTKRFFLSLPSLVNDEEVGECIKKINAINPDGILFSNLAFKGVFKNELADYNMNVFNDFDLNFFGKSIISPELNIDELKQFRNKDFVVFAHGNIAVMTTKNPLPNKLADEKGFVFPVVKENDYFKVLNSKQIALLDKIVELNKNGIKQFYFDLDRNVKKWLNAYSRILRGEQLNLKRLGKGFTKGHAERGVF